LSRWRGGRERIEEGEEIREAEALGHPEPVLDALDGEEVRIKTPSTEAAEALVDVLRKHGVACELRRPHAAEVKVVIPEGVAPGDVMGLVVHGVELWLLLPTTPDEVEVRCGGETVVVRRPSPEGLKPAELLPISKG
jgi:hypothetical protein